MDRAHRDDRHAHHGNLQGDDPRGRKLATLSLAALGVVFGDIGTSPLYSLRECFHGPYGIAVTSANLLGVLSLMCWSLILVVSVKYLTFILRADNHGEGGVLALTALLPAGFLRRKGQGWILLAFGLFGASLLYGDGMITPAITVLSAVEGLQMVAPALQHYVLPSTIAILAGLFLIQRRGTAGIGSLFGPVLLIWFLAIGVLGLHQIIREPDVLAALSPWHAMTFLLRNRVHGFIVLGAVVLVVTGTEALYADMGHFGRKPIRLTWFFVALPALLLNYFGQGALLLSNPNEAHQPFYGLVPVWALAPMILLATAATIIASQAIISGAFSLTRQAIQLGYCPRLQIVHTSAEKIGQIYLPRINLFLMLATIGLVLGFRTSSRLAAAYGVAVTGTMLISTILFYTVARQRWGWNRFVAGAFVGFFLVIDLSFFGANVIKITHGAWFPLVIGAMGFTLMVTWKRGRELLADRLRPTAIPSDEFVKTLMLHPPHRVPGKAVFLTGSPGTVPTALLHNLKHNKVLHTEVAFLSVATEEVPRVARDRKVEVRNLGDGFYSIIAHYGFVEDPNIPHILAMAREKGLPFELKDCSFFLGRERLLPSKKAGLSRWRVQLFSFMARNALDATTFYRIPPNQVLEIGAQLKL